MQSWLVLHRTRSLLIRQQTSVSNAIRGHLAEFGIVAPVGRNGLEALLSMAASEDDTRLPEIVRRSIEALSLQLRALKAQILEFDRKILQWHRSNELSKRLDDIPGLGPALATALVASIADPKSFRSGRDFSAWVGLVPKQHSSGGKPRLGGITKQGDRYLRSLFTVGALAVIRYAKIHGTQHRPWLGPDADIACRSAGLSHTVGTLRNSVFSGGESRRAGAEAATGKCLFLIGPVDRGRPIRLLHSPDASEASK